MSGASDFLEGEMGKHLLRTGSWTKPAAIYVCLFTTIPNDDGSGGVEVTGSGYARIQHGPLDTKWAAPVAGNGAFTNIGVIQFGAPTTNWGTVTGFGIYDAVTGGNLLVKGPISTNVTINSGDPAPAFAEGIVSVTLG